MSLKTTPDEGKTVRLEHSSNLGRIIRKDSLAELGVSTWTKTSAAIQAGRLAEAIALVDYNWEEGRRVHDIMCDAFWGFQTCIAETFGEEELYKAMRRLSEPFNSGLAKLTIEELVQMRAETMRAHRCGPKLKGDFTVTEEKDRYVLTFDPCGSGGRMRRTGREKPPYNYGKTKKAYPWSWGKVGVPYYCVHCCIWQEILPIEMYGYPLRVTAYNDDPHAPCGWYIYKKPELIPEEYFTRVGVKKDISRMKKPV
ncbi:MAG: hypothetical protein Q7R57_03445 [Dehalococcoidales bacterium]|nr:hypothetical protein [Dehalococcoidales bacterium]